MRVSGGAAGRPGPSAGQHGVTLIELMTVVAVITLLTAVTAPSLRSFGLRNQVASSQSAFTATLAFARSEAARRGVSVFVVAASGGASGNEYANGWDVYADNDADGVFGAADAPSLRHQDALPPLVVMRGAARTTFGADGYLSPAAAKTFMVCQAGMSKAEGRLVTVPPGGIADVTTVVVANPSDCLATAGAGA